MKATVRAAGEAQALELPKGLSLGKPGADLALASFGLDGVVALRSEGDGWLSGSLGTYGIADVLGFVLAGVRSGRLVVAVRGTHRKTVTVRDGQVTFATSTEPHERLGPTLVRLGLVTAAQVDQAVAQVKPGRKLGQVLTQSGALGAASLYDAMATLVREIVLGLAGEEEGHFLFVEGTPPAEDVIKLPERTRDLVLEGMKRSSEAARKRLQPQSEAPAKPAAATASARPSALDRYAALVKTICDALAKAGRDLADLRSFLDDPLPGMETAFKGVTLSDQGVLDVQRVLNNALHDRSPLGRARAFEALDAFVNYALFSAKNVLPPELAESLAKDFRRIHEGEP